MAIRKYVAISYCFAFLCVYLSGIAYALLSESINKTYDMALPQTTAMNSTVSAISSFSSGGSTLIIIGVIILIISILFIISSVRSMSSAI